MVKYHVINEDVLQVESFKQLQQSIKLLISVAALYSVNLGCGGGIIYDSN